MPSARLDPLSLSAFVLPIVWAWAVAGLYTVTWRPTPACGDLGRLSAAPRVTLPRGPKA